MTEINDSGFVRDRYQDERDSIAGRWQVYLPGRRTDVQSVNGRIISIEAELVDNQNGQIGALLESFSPFTARGNLLSRLAPLMSKRRREAVLSSVTLTVTAGPAGTTIPAGSIVSQVAGPAKFITTVQVIVAPSGAATVPAVATIAGSVEAASGTLTKIDTPVSGWLTVTNDDDASVGRERESDGQLRARMLSTSSAPVGTPEGIATAISEVDGVSYQFVLENRTSSVNGIGMPPHSVFPIVDGGADLAIGEALLRSVAAGIDYTDSTDIPTGPNWVSVVVTNPSNNQPVTVWFSRTTPVSAAIVVTIETQSGFPADGAARIKSEIVSFVNQWPVGQTLFISRLYSPANNVPGHEINSLTINATDRRTLAPFERLQITAANVTVTVV
jgi:uncharacterized phage protein gp47/JayE